MAPGANSTMTTDAGSRRQSVHMSNNLTELIRTMLEEQGGRPLTDRKESPRSEVIYVVVVIVFYAVALMMLIASQVRRPLICFFSLSF